MREKETGENRGNVVELAIARRKRLRLQAASERRQRRAVATALHVEITADGEVSFPPLVVHAAQAMALLQIVLAVSTHLVDVHYGRI